MSGIRRRVIPRSRAEIRQYAEMVRALVANPTGYFDVMELLEFVLPKKIHGFEFQVMPEEKMHGNLGVTIPDKNVIFLREDVYEGALDGNGHHRMTVAHEIGHLLLHKGLPSSFARVESSEEIPPFRCSEWQANCFGGELLVPAKGLSPLDTPMSIAQRYGVTIQAAEIQRRKK